MWGKIVSSVSNALDFNQATLSGCIDIIICIESEIENKLKNDKIEVIYKSTPFHVRFGKTKLLRSKEKIVSILVNGKSTNLHMKLGSAGEAYFVEKTYEDVEEDLETSPLSSPRNEYYYFYDDHHIDSCSIDDSLNNFKSDEDDSDKVFLLNTALERKKSTDKHSKTERNKSKKHKDSKEEHKKNNSFIKKERLKEENSHDKKNHGIDQDSDDDDDDEDDDDIIDRNIKQFNLTDKRREEFDDQNINSEWSWSWGRLPHLKTHDAVSDNNNSINSSVNKKKHKNKIKTKTYYKKSESVNEHATNKDDPIYIPKRNLSESHVRKTGKKKKLIKDRSYDAHNNGKKKNVHNNTNMSHKEKKKENTHHSSKETNVNKTHPNNHDQIKETLKKDRKFSDPTGLSQVKPCNEQKRKTIAYISNQKIKNEGNNNLSIKDQDGQAIKESNTNMNIKINKLKEKETQIEKKEANGDRKGSILENMLKNSNHIRKHSKNINKYADNRRLSDNKLIDVESKVKEVENEMDKEKEKEKEKAKEKVKEIMIEKVREKEKEREKLKELEKEKEKLYKKGSIKSNEKDYTKDNTKEDTKDNSKDNIKDHINDQTKDITNDQTKDITNEHNKKQLKKGIDKKHSSSLDNYTHKEIDSNDDNNNNNNDNNNNLNQSKGDQDAIFDDDIQNRIECSLCGHLLLNQNIDNEQNDYNIEIHNKNIFEANIVTYDQIDKNSNLWYHPSLVFRFDKKDPYYPSRVALPLLASWVVFNQPLSILAVEKLLNSSLTLSEVKDKSWRNWFGVSSAEYDNTTNNKSTNKDTKTNNQIEDKKKKKEQGDKNNIIERKDSKDSKSKRDTLHSLHNQSELSKRSSVRRSQDRIRVRYRKSLRPTSEQLQSLNLKEGANTITFLVTSSLQGTKSITGNIYLWKKNAKIVISDVDGTITKSTVLGHIMPIVGKDWSHVGVSQLFNKINKNGYHILYLTARAIGQADSTREYLFRLKKNDNNKLPDGPLILSPDRLFPSFKREVIDKKPYIFKIAALRDIRNLFPLNHNPFYAAFGNTESDHRAYISVGVPEAKVFIIDNRGIVHHVNSTYAKTYETMSEITEHMFPCIKNDKKREDDDQYNSFQYWKINSLSFYEKYMNVSDSS
ncbi:putative HAD superfamily protein [Plasmodium gaboni]|uniref:phosphatidate phosphatase n=1 Tax=Plasmodium gaboni TaxID=647221 RepID=A0A151LVF1_9APIC|nr:putative HAD superfamily protein [Plasmodium gaboni]KYO03151.1 putative HAD superfamily protein [Plasmodium gaboni]